MHHALRIPLAFLLTALLSGSATAAQEAEGAVSLHTRPELQKVVRRLLGAAQELERCVLVRRGGGEQIECARTECRSCNVTHVLTAVVRKQGRWTVGETRRENRGDTGECGCCM